MRHYVAKKSQYDMQARLLNARMLGELTKFGVWEPSSVFKSLRLLIDSGTASDYEVASSLVEVCGNYLYRRKDTHARMENFVGILKRNREVGVCMCRVSFLSTNISILVSML